MKVRMLGVERVVRAFIGGVSDGYQQPWELGSGLTYDDWDALNEAYDRGANVGQLLGKLFRYHTIEV